MYIEYIYIVQHFIVFLLIGLLLCLVSFLFIYQQPRAAKISAYECGFNPFGDARNKFEIRYYIVALLFIIFDLELLFLFPWIISIGGLTQEGILYMIFFLFVLTLGFIYEWKEGALDWN